LGIELCLVVPASWAEDDAEGSLSSECFPIIELAVDRVGDVNRHSYRSGAAIASIVEAFQPDVLDVHEEPFSVAGRQWLRAAPPQLPIVMYTAQNIDKRFPPPFSRYERRAYARVNGFYPCSRQAASVIRGKGFAGLVDVIPLGYDPDLFFAGNQSSHDEEIILGLFGRLVAEKGVSDSVRILAGLCEKRAARLVLVGSGPESVVAEALARELGVADRLDVHPWLPVEDLARQYRETHFVLVPSVPTYSWVEQFGRVIVEAQASGAVVAAYATGAIPEVAGDGALMAQAHDFAGLGALLAAAAADEDDYQARRRVGFQLSGRRTWSSVAQRHADLYARVARRPPRLVVPRDVRERRRLARAEFGRTAPTQAGERPFALPLLRRGGLVSRGLARALDAGTSLVERFVGPHRASSGR
jgi:glycosyltransferase involved in cell wall biosynthesis